MNEWNINVSISCSHLRIVYFIYFYNDLRNISGVLIILYIYLRMNGLDHFIVDIVCFK
jgi:hypothetical protein